MAVENFVKGSIWGKGFCWRIWGARTIGVGGGVGGPGWRTNRGSRSASGNFSVLQDIAYLNF